MTEKSVGEIELRRALRPVRRRLVGHHFWLWFVNGLVTGTGVAALVLLAARFVPWYGNHTWAELGLAVGAVATWAWAFAGYPGVWQAALAADRAGLKERAGTAWQLRESMEPLALHQRLDALAHLARFDCRSSLRWPWPKKRLAATGLCLAGIVALLWWPNSQDRIAEERRQTGQIVRQAQTEVQKAADAIRLDQALDPEQRKKLAESFEKLNRELGQAKTPEAAAAAIAKTQKQTTAGLSGQEEKAKLAKLAYKLQQTGAGRQAGLALQQRDAGGFEAAMAEMARKLNNMSSEDKERLSKLMEDLAAAAGNQGDSELAQALRQAGQDIANGKLGERLLQGATDKIRSELADLADVERLGAEVNANLNRAKGNLLVASSHSGQRSGSGANSTGANGNASGGNGVSNGNAGQGQSGQNGASGNGGSDGANGGTNGSPGTGSSGTGGANSGSSGDGSNGAGTNGTGGSGGSGGGNGSGFGGNGTGSGSGGSGSGGGSGGGKSGNAAGNGSSNQTGSMYGRTTVGAAGSGQAGGSAIGHEGQWEQIYAPSSRLGGTGPESHLSGQPGQGDNSGPNNGNNSTTIDSANGPVSTGTLIPYTDVLADYQAEALETMDKDYVPENLKGLVRDYFLGLAGEQ